MLANIDLTFAQTTIYLFFVPYFSSSRLSIWKSAYIIGAPSALVIYNEESSCGMWTEKQLAKHYGTHVCI